ncbi:MAG: hypothetical protein K6T71_01525 [Candidatus Bipolaricaulota bacterium]|nr:hypothetical protein [Candidatus Bipolaricaulota bacterium]
MLNLFDELYIGMAARERQDRLEREAARERLLAEAQAQRHKPQNGRAFAQFLALALKTFGINGQMNWKL